MVVLEQSPWPRLTLAVSLEAIFLSCFVRARRQGTSDTRGTRRLSRADRVPLAGTDRLPTPDRLLDERTNRCGPLANVAAAPPACNDDGMGAPEETVGVRAPGVVARRALYERLSAGVSAGVTLVSAPPGSGKTVLLRSWIDEAGLRARTAWVLVERHERDAQRFWLSVVDAAALRGRQGRARAASSRRRRSSTATGWCGA